MSYEIVFTGSFKDEVRRLKKRYRHVADDVAVAIEALLENPKLSPVIANAFGVRKLRVTNRDANRGKRGGYRILYFLVDEEQKQIYLLLIYSKSEREDVDAKEIEQLIKRAGLR